MEPGESTQPKRPLLVSTAYPPSLGGAQLHAQELMRAVARLGHTPHVATVWRTSRTDWLRGTTIRAPDAPPGTEHADGVQVHGVTVHSRLAAARAAAAFYPVLLTTGGAATVRRWAPRLFRAALSEVMDVVQPTVVHLTRIGREHLYAAAIDVAQERGLPVVLTANHHEGWSRRRDRWWWDLYRSVDGIIALGDVEVDLLQQGGVSADRIHRSSVGIVGAPVARRAHEHPTVAFVGQAQPHKGLDLLAAAWPRVTAVMPRARLEIVGPWPRGQHRLRTTLEQMAGVVVHGPVPQETKWRVLASTDVLAVPSAGESLGGVYLEAWAAGAVPVGADIPQVRALLDGAGRVAPRQAQPIAELILELLGDPDQRTTLVRQGQERLATTHDWHTIAETTVAIYRAVSD